MDRRSDLAVVYEYFNTLFVYDIHFGILRRNVLCPFPSALMILLFPVSTAPWIPGPSGP